MDFKEIGYEGAVQDSPVDGSCEHVIGLSIFLKGGEFLDQTRNYLFIKNDNL
jgi:hypothetical protein